MDVKKNFIVGFLVTLLIAAVLLVRDFKYPGDGRVRRMLAGTWEVSWGDMAHSTNVVSTDGAYECRIIDPIGGRNIELGGTLRVEGGFLIDTMTRNSLPNVHLPTTNRGRIIRATRSQMVVDYTGGKGSPVYYKKVSM